MEEQKKVLQQGLNYLKANNLNSAIDIFNKVLNETPNNYEANFYLGTIYAKLNDTSKALQFLKKTSEINPSNADVYNNLGIVNLNLKKFDEAAKYFEKSIKLKKNFTVAICNLGIALNNLNKVQQAKEKFSFVIELDPKNILANYNLGCIFKREGNQLEAEKYLFKAINLSPKFLPAYNNLLEIFDKSNQNTKLDEFLQKAENIFPNNPVIILFRARHFYKIKKYNDVIKLLINVKFDQSEIFHEQAKLEIIAKSYDHLKDFENSFNYFVKSNDVSGKINPFNADKNIFFNLVEKKLNFFTNKNLKNWKKIGSQNLQDPIFLVGFPRSGTTLLDTILRTHPLIDVIEEKPIVDRFVVKLEEEINSDLSKLANIDEKFYIKMRKTYLDLRKESHDVDPKKLCIDKMPLNLIFIGEIIRFFPNAKFIFALRHPYDCVLSCFMQNFRLNNAMATFLKLEDAAKSYNLVMTLWENLRNNIDIKYHQIKYEDLVADFDNTVKNLLKFLEVDWDQSLKKFYETAGKRGIMNTPSYNQVSQPIYSKSINRWKNYETKFENLKVLLDPWVKKFNYNQN